MKSQIQHESANSWDSNWGLYILTSNGYLRYWSFLFEIDMLFEEDTTLLSFFDRYQEDDDYEDLQESIKKYCGANTE